MRNVSAHDYSIPVSAPTVKVLRRDLPDWLKDFGNYEISFGSVTISVTKLTPLTAYVLDRNSRCNCYASVNGKSCRHEKMVGFIQNYFVCPVHAYRGSAHDHFLVVEFRGTPRLMCQDCLLMEQGWFGKNLTEAQAILVRESLLSSEKYAVRRSVKKEGNQ